MIDKEYKTTMSLRNPYGQYTVTVNEADLPIGDILEDVVKPLLLAAGYSEQNIEEYLGLEFDGDEGNDEGIKPYSNSIMVDNIEDIPGYDLKIPIPICIDEYMADSFSAEDQVFSRIAEGESTKEPQIIC